MLERIRQRLSYANVMATLAVFIALGGGSVAAVQLTKNSIGPKQLKKNSVTRAKIKKGAVNSRKVADESLLAKDFKPGQLPTGATGAQGPQGEAGTAVAYAHVLSDGTVVASESKNISQTNVVKPPATLGTYCFTLNFTPKNMVATLDITGNTAVTTRGEIGTSGGFCTPPISAHVNTLTFAGGGFLLANGSFYVMFN